jgi:hypothetical protein
MEFPHPLLLLEADAAGASVAAAATVRWRNKLPAVLLLTLFTAMTDSLLVLIKDEVLLLLREDTLLVGVLLPAFLCVALMTAACIAAWVGLCPRLAACVPEEELRRRSSLLVPALFASATTAALWSTTFGMVGPAMVRVHSVWATLAIAVFGLLPLVGAGAGGLKISARLWRCMASEWRRAEREVAPDEVAAALHSELI